MPGEKRNHVGPGAEGVAQVHQEKDQFGVRALEQGFGLQTARHEFRLVVMIDQAEPGPLAALAEAA